LVALPDRKVSLLSMINRHATSAEVLQENQVRIPNSERISCKELRRGSGGRIGLESEPGKGTRFRVELSHPAETQAQESLQSTA
jgi:hypothetical protein